MARLIARFARLLFSGFSWRLVTGSGRRWSRACRGGGGGHSCNASLKHKKFTDCRKKKLSKFKILIQGSGGLRHTKHNTVNSAKC